ncbi:Signal recognition particle-docking protein FtsY [Acetoanaerobium sticklandii]|uniref:Signal recognition particle receptor FtsY n=1 Tax=Acetoanaerobium sticklandii (strain ATCC 12662 / DSM 519 / JCM 1433 / CCUG 9281 / NCIMB 10654 / HF) TaxID=499177 RepID=E3PS48_ACESD|nr:signal recognition particle-docking protein FtsY [Acetoanaerobium sticklandii]CBH21702.1 Signal recognition particle-docking protein FtsY [Acetoanaerobium sticklandii]
MLKKFWNSLNKKNDNTNEEIVEKDDLKAEEENLENAKTDEDINANDMNEDDKEVIEEESIVEKSVEENIEENIEETTLNDNVEADEIEELSLSQAESDMDEDEEQPQKNLGFFAKLKEGLSKTTQNLTGKLDELFKGHIEIDEELYEEIEEILITGDVGFETTLKIVDMLRKNVKKKSIQDVKDVREELKLIVEEILSGDDSNLKLEPKPAILVIVGVNGVGKTTSIGKIAMRLKSEGKSVLLAAGDTFRAAAAEQLEVWADRAGVELIKHQEGSDPSAVIFDAISGAKARNTDVLICDTAGRLHNKKNLMQELAKIFRIIDREYPEATKEVLLVIDATTGQNAINQVKIFKEAAPLTGIILTKLDGTAKGGVVLSIKSEQQLPIKLIGVGEKIEDLQDFNAKEFAKALFSSN